MSHSLERQAAVGRPVYGDEPMHGYLFIADITGYTAYLSETELDHARSTLEDLLKLLLREIHPPLQVSKLEGDAVLAYTPETSGFSGQTMVDMVERIYGAFRRAIELMDVNSTCDCSACKAIPRLDLKFFVHHGEFAMQDVGRFTELVGTDVNLIHRLTKNSVAEIAYALYTRAALDAAAIDVAATGFRNHSETYEHIGEVPCAIQNMGPVWERRRAEHRLHVGPEGSVFVINRELPVPRAIAWEYMTRPDTRALVVDSDSATLEGRVGGRIGVGTQYHCAHGDAVSVQTIVDWAPFDYYTYAFAPLPGGEAICSVTFEDRGATTGIIYTARPGGTPFRRFLVRVAGALARRRLERGLQVLDEKIHADLDSGVLHAPPAPAGFSADSVREAAVDSLPKSDS